MMVLYLSGGETIDTTCNAYLAKHANACASAKDGFGDKGCTMALACGFGRVHPPIEEVLVPTHVLHPGVSGNLEPEALVASASTGFLEFLVLSCTVLLCQCPEPDSRLDHEAGGFSDASQLAP